MSRSGVNHLKLVGHQAREHYASQETAMNALQNIESTRHALRDALANEDWDNITALDLQCRACLDHVLDDKSIEPHVLRESLEDLLALYRELVAATTSVRQSIAAQMAQARQGHQAARVYHLAHKGALMR